MTEPWTPTSDELGAIFAPVRGFSRLVLAVSGGSDSVALMHLTARWGSALGSTAPNMSVATVDHGLRPGSDREADAVVDAARALGLDAMILRWTGRKPERGIQASAREARYALLGEHAAKGGAGSCAILTAHTLDDQAETVLMRLARGSGPDGLAGMRSVRPLEGYSGVVLVRPLLGHMRAQLRAFLRSNGVRWIDDPSNEDQRFERVRLRAAADTLHQVGLTPQMLALAAQRQRRAVVALEAATDALAASALDVHGGMFAALDQAAFRGAPLDVRIRLLARVLHMFGGSSEPAELAQIERLAEALSDNPSTQVTLGGCAVRACDRQIRVFREKGRAALPTIELRPGETTVWDGRFFIRHKAQPGGRCDPVVVRALDGAAAGLLRRRVALPSRAAATLPAVWAGDDLVAVGGLPDGVFTEGRHSAARAVETRFVFAAPERAA